MILKMDLEEITIPLAIEKAFRKAKEEGLKGEEREWWEQSDGDCLKEWWMDEGCELFEPPEIGLIDKEIAEFLIEYKMENIAFGGGYQKESELIFEDNGYRYTICAYGWSSDLEDKNIDISMIGYKEKIKEEK